MCGAIKRIEDDTDRIALCCDGNHYSGLFHHDEVHNVFWPIEEVHTYSVVNEPNPTRWVHEGLPVPAIIGG